MPKSLSEHAKRFGVLLGTLVGWTKLTIEQQQQQQQHYCYFYCYSVMEWKTEHRNTPKKTMSNLSVSEIF